MKEAGGQEGAGMKPISHMVHYYETDKMGVTHHSNYIRWMENARIDYLGQIGCGYAECEAMGLTAPVTGFSCRIKSSTRFGDEVLISARILKYTGVRLNFFYRVTRPDGSAVAEGETDHCFLNADGKVIALQREFPQLHENLLAQIEREKGEENHA